MYDAAVIVVTYNSDLRKTLMTLQSCLAQKGLRFQIVIADDGSQESNFGHIVSFFRMRGFEDYVLCSSPTNTGTVKNVARALSNVDAPYVKTISPGDYFYENCTLDRMVYQLRIDGSAFCFGRPLLYTSLEPGGIVNRQLPIDMEPYCNPWRIANRTAAKRNLIRYKDGIYGTTLAYRRDDFIEAISRLVDKVPLCEDYSAKLMLLDNAKYSFLNNYVVWYEYGTGISTKKYPKGLGPRRQDWIDLCKVFEEDYITDSDAMLYIQDVRLKTSGHPTPIKALLRLAKDPERLLFTVRKKIVDFRYKAVDYDFGLLASQLNNEELDSFYSEFVLDSSETVNASSKCI